MENAHEAPLVVLPLLAVLLGYGAAMTRNEHQCEGVWRLRPVLDGSAALTLATIMHVVLSRTGWYHRYEAYLIIWGLVATAGSVRAWQACRACSGQTALPEGIRAQAIVGLVAVAVLMLLAFGLRINAYNTAPRASRNIYEQHVQMGRFVARFYPDRPIVLHDIGYVGYMSSGPLLDIGGLATYRIAMAKSRGMLDKSFVARVAREHGARTAISYAHAWVPDQWVKVASWRIRDNRVAGSDTVCFYAVDGQAADDLIHNLRTFQPGLPRGVTVEYYPWAPVG